MSEFDTGVAPLAEPVITGNAAVDAVVAAVDAGRDAPIGEHVAVFESAHEALRSALDVRDAPTPA